MTNEAVYNSITKEIPLVDILFWQENDRTSLIGPALNQEEQIKFLIQEGKKELKELIISISTLGLLSKDLWIIKKNRKYIMKEGNRRLIALKYLSGDPLVSSLIHQSYGDLKDLLGPIKDFNTITVEVWSNQELLEKAITLKHTPGNGGEGQLNWGAVITRKRKQKEKQTLPGALLEFCEEEGIISDQKGLNESFRRFFTIDRSKKLGVSLNQDCILLEGISKEELSSFLANFIQDIRDGVATSRNELASASLKEEYESKLLEKSKVKFNKDDNKTLVPINEPENSLFENAPDTETLGKSLLTMQDQQSEKSKVLRSTSRSHKGLIPSGVPFKLHSSSLQQIYIELRDLSVSEFPNASHDLLRSFLECSTIEFLSQSGEYQNIVSNPNHTPKLSEMLTYIINNRIIDNQNILDILDSVKGDWSKPFSLQRLNAINHNPYQVSSENDARVAWNKLEPYFKHILQKDNIKIRSKV